MCKNESKPAISGDRGLLDLSFIFGVNFRQRDAVKFRKKTTYTVLPMEGHYEIIGTRGNDEPSSLFRRILGLVPLPGEPMLVAKFGTIKSEEAESGIANTTFSQILVRKIGITVT